jgi:YebC/PmpR family DNA-binding regulatory protein
VALYVETLSDNRNRTGSEVRSLLSKNGGSLAEPGSVAWQFERKGIILIPEGIDEDEIMMVALEAGAEDLVDEGGIWRLTCDPSVLSEVRLALETADLDFNSADVTMLPTTTVVIDNESDARSVLKVIDLLDDLDDVQDVYANFDIPNEIFDLIQD